MKAGRIHAFGPPTAIVIDELPHPMPAEVELVVRVAAAGVGPWDALIREGKSVVQPSLPVILGSDFAGIVHSVGTGVIRFKPGDEVFGVTNKQFCGAYAEQGRRIRVSHPGRSCCGSQSRAPPAVRGGRPVFWTNFDQFEPKKHVRRLEQRPRPMNDNQYQSPKTE